MKTIAKIKGLAWLDKSTLSQLAEYQCKNKLTIIPRATSTFADPDPIRLFANTDRWLGVPRQFLVQHEREIFPEGIEYECHFPESYPELSIIDSPVILRPHQQKAFDEIIPEMMSQNYARGFFGGLLEAYTAFGRTITAIYIAKEIGFRTIVFVHRISLADQWMERIKQFYPGYSVGMVGAGKRDWLDKDIVITSMQTLFRAKMPPEFYRNFGLLIVDEVHVTGAPTFASTIPKFESKYILGVSGTMRRQDGCENVFRYLIGDIVHAATNEGRVNPKIWVRDTGFEPDYPMDHLEKPHLLNALASSKERTAKIAFDLFTAYKKKRNPLVLSERLKILKDLPMLIDYYCEKEGLIKPSHGFYIGGKKKAELEKAAECDIVYATYQLAKEGVDIPRLDFLSLATPTSDPEQAIGRVCRSHPGKPQPVVADYVDFNLQRPTAQYYKRRRLYRKLGWEILEPQK